MVSPGPGELPVLERQAEVRTVVTRTCVDFVITLVGGQTVTETRELNDAILIQLLNCLIHFDRYYYLLEDSSVTHYNRPVITGRRKQRIMTMKSHLAQCFLVTPKKMKIREKLNDGNEESCD